MWDLQRAFEDFPLEIDLGEPAIDSEFITDFLQPYFRNMTREQLAAQLAEIIAGEHVRQKSPLRLR